MDAEGGIDLAPENSTFGRVVCGSERGIGVEECNDPNAFLEVAVCWVVVLAREKCGFLAYLMADFENVQKPARDVTVENLITRPWVLRRPVEVSS